jgi:FMN phosphatase YigB (HAD superfamily)
MAEERESASRPGGTASDPAGSIVFLVDVDNTLLDNDRIEQDLRDHLEQSFGHETCQGYWNILEQLRQELGYADFLGALQRYRVQHLHDPRLLEMSSFLVDYPFADRLYPKALDVIAHLETMGAVVILSDGDAVFQPRKVERSGLWAAVKGRVLIYIHKEEMLDDVEHHYPAEHYVFIDDKLRLLTAVKQSWNGRVTTVFPQQGHYALDPAIVNEYPPADKSVARIGDLMDYEIAA